MCIRDRSYGIKGVRATNPENLEKVINDQFSVNTIEKIIARCIINVVAKDEDFIKKNNLRVDWTDL